MRSYKMKGRLKTYIDCLMADELDTYYAYKGRNWDGWRKDDKHKILYKARINEKQLDIKRMEREKCIT